MQYKTVKSNEEPSATQYLQGKVLINIDITSTTDDDDITTYSYTQIVADSDADSDTITAEYRANVAREYLESTDYIDNKYVSEVIVLQTSTVDEFTESHSEMYELREAARESIRAVED